MDSEILLRYLKNDKSRFQTYVVNRVERNKRELSAERMESRARIPKSR